MVNNETCSYFSIYVSLIFSYWGFWDELKSFSTFSLPYFLKYKKEWGAQKCFLQNLSMIPIYLFSQKKMYLYSYVSLKECWIPLT